MERYNLSAEHLVKLLYRKKINRVTTTSNSENFLIVLFLQKFLEIIL